MDKTILNQSEIIPLPVPITLINTTSTWSSHAKIKLHYVEYVERYIKIFHYEVLVFLKTLFCFF